MKLYYIFWHFSQTKSNLTKQQNIIRQLSLNTFGKKHSTSSASSFIRQSKENFFVKMKSKINNFI